MQNPKYLHIAAGRRRGGAYNGKSLCGRLVNIMALTNEGDATCTRCLAESLATSTQQVQANPGV